MTTKPKPRNPVPKTRRQARTRAKSIYELYPMPFFDVESRCLWKVQPSGNYGDDCNTGHDYALKFLESCDGTAVWSLMLNWIVLEMVAAGPMREKWPGGKPHSNGIIVGFMGAIGTVLTWSLTDQDMRTSIIDALRQRHEGAVNRNRAAA